MQTIAVVQARTSSSRLPGKVMMPILGTPMIIHQLWRVQRSKLIDKIILATSDNVSDDQLALLCERAGFNVFRGSLNNVLDRFQKAIAKEDYANIVRITGDCPLCDPKIIDDVIESHLNSKAEYTSNALKPSFPDGLDVEVITKAAFQKVLKSAFLPSQLEHVTPYVYQNPTEFKINEHVSKMDFSKLRWTVDELIDFEFVSEIYRLIYPKKPDFGMEDVLKVINSNCLIKFDNSGIKRNEGYAISLLQDLKYEL